MSALGRGLPPGHRLLLAFSDANHTEPHHMTSAVANHELVVGQCTENACSLTLSPEMDTQIFKKTPRHTRAFEQASSVCYLRLLPRSSLRDRERRLRSRSLSLDRCHHKQSFRHIP